jgi:protochlorophyllide reductase
MRSMPSEKRPRAASLSTFSWIWLIWSRYAARMRWDDLQWTRSYGRYRAYGQSKLSNVLFALELDRRRHEGGHSSLAAVAHPGLALSDLQKNAVANNHSGFERALYGFLLPRLAQSAEQGSWPQLRAATDPDIVGGEFFGPNRFATRGFPVPVRLPKHATMEAAARLWTVSEELTGIQFSL